MARHMELHMYFQLYSRSSSSLAACHDLCYFKVLLVAVAVAGTNHPSTQIIIIKLHAIEWQWNDGKLLFGIFTKVPARLNGNQRDTNTNTKKNKYKEKKNLDAVGNLPKRSITQKVSSG